MMHLLKILQEVYIEIPELSFQISIIEVNTKYLSNKSFNNVLGSLVLWTAKYESWTDLYGIWKAHAKSIKHPKSVLYHAENINHLMVSGSYRWSVPRMSRSQIEPYTRMCMYLYHGALNITDNFFLFFLFCLDNHKALDRYCNWKHGNCSL